MEFKVAGSSRHGKPEGEPEMSEEPEKNTDPSEFINQITEQVIPTIAK